MPIIKSTKVVDEQEVTIYIEVDKAYDPNHPYNDLRDNVASKIISATRDAFGEGVELARNCATRVVDGVKGMASTIRPDEFEIQFAIKLDSEVGAIIAKASTGAQMQVTMKWVRDKKEEQA